MNSHAKFRGAARRGFSVIYEKPPGGADIRPPPSVRGLRRATFLGLRQEQNCADPDLAAVPRRPEK